MRRKGDITEEQTNKQKQEIFKKWKKLNEKIRLCSASLPRPLYLTSREPPDIEKVSVSSARALCLKGEIWNPRPQTATPPDAEGGAAGVEEDGLVTQFQWVVLWGFWVV